MGEKILKSRQTVTIRKCFGQMARSSLRLSTPLNSSGVWMGARERLEKRPAGHSCLKLLIEWASAR
jgi:hypothetical protein